jgi:hypothetical protein
VILSLPVVSLVAMGKAAVFAYRSLRVRNKWFTLVSLLCIVAMIGILAFVVVVLFIYGVSHGEKNTESDLVVLALTAFPTYICAASVWWIIGNARKKLYSSTTQQVT